LITFLDAFQKYSVEWLKSKKGEKKLTGRMEVMTVTELLRRLGRKAEGVNLLEVETYLRHSKVFV